MPRILNSISLWGILIHCLLSWTLTLRLPKTVDDALNPNVVDGFERFRCFQSSLIQIKSTLPFFIYEFRRIIKILFNFHPKHTNKYYTIIENPSTIDKHSIKSFKQPNLPLKSILMSRSKKNEEYLANGSSMICTFQRRIRNKAPNYCLCSLCLIFLLQVFGRFWVFNHEVVSKIAFNRWSNLFK